MSIPKPFQVYIVDADPAARTTLQTLFESMGLRATACANPAAFHAIYHPDHPACLVWGMPLLSADQSDLLQQLRQWQIEVPVLAIAACADVALAVAILKQGALDFLEKPVNEQLLLDGVHHALRLEAKRLEGQQQRQDFCQRFAALTAREQEVLHGVMAGLSNREIAQTLNLSCKTVEIHRAKVMQKTQADSLARLIHMALAVGILPLWEEEEALTEPLTAVNHD